MALITGAQLAAARSLLQIDQQQLAEKAELTQKTISTWERYGDNPIQGQIMKLHGVQKWLESQGIEFLNDDAPGVRLRRKTKAKKKP